MSPGGRGGGKGVRWVGLTTLPHSCADCLEILAASDSRIPKGLSRPVMGLLYLYREEGSTPVPATATQKNNADIQSFWDTDSKAWPQDLIGSRTYELRFSWTIYGSVVSMCLQRLTLKTLHFFHSLFTNFMTIHDCALYFCLKITQTWSCRVWIVKDIAL
jgi:hypothetical protein